MKILICDDDPQILKVLASMLREYEDVQCYTFESCAALLTKLEFDEGAADAVFMDILFPDGEGIDTAVRIHEQYPYIKIVMITGYLEYAPEIWEADPVYLLAKPIDAEKLSRAVNTIRERMAKERQTTLAVPFGGGVQQIPIADIEYIESDRRTIVIHGDFEEPVVCYSRLDDIAEKLPRQFERCHQSYLVNLDRMRYLGTKDVLMVSGTRIPIAQRRRAEFQRLARQYLASADLLADGGPEDSGEH